MEVIILFGAPGVGKGTQAELVVKNLGYVHLSTGILFRKEIASGSEFGKEVASIINKGVLMPDEITNKLVENFFEENKEAEGIILDGYPRTVSQARELDKMLEELEGANLRIINLIVDEEELVKRLSLREKKLGRPDDSEESRKHRFEVYENETFPILDYYENTGADVSEVDGEGSVEEIQNRILKVLIGN